MLSFSQELEKVEYREKEAQKIKNNIATCIQFGFVVSHSCLKHDEGPGQNQRNHDVDNMPKDHIKFFFADEFPNWIGSFEAFAKPADQSDQDDISNKDEKRN